MKFIFNTNGNILESENTESIIQFSVNANEIYMTFADIPMSEYIGYISFERADGKTSPLIGMQYCKFLSPSDEPTIGFKYSFSDAWVTAIAGILKVVFTLKRNGIVVKTATINLNIIESIAEDEVNYIDDVAYNALVHDLQETQQKIPTKVSQLENDKYYAQENFVIDKIEELMPKNISQLYNDKGYITGKEVDEFKVSQFDNDAGYITKDVDVLENFLNRFQVESQILMHLQEYYNKEQIDNKISTIPKFNIEVVSQLPISNISNTTVYLLNSGSGDNLYTEYIYVNNKWELLGTQELDLTGYAKTEDVPTKVSQLENDSEFVNVYELKEYVNSKSPKNIGELESDPQNEDNIVLNYLNEDGIYHFTYQGENGIIFVKKLVLNPNYPDNFDVIQTILYNPVESNCDISMVRRTLSFISNSLTYTDIFNQGTLATTQEYLSYLQYQYYDKEKVNELLSLIPKFNIEVVQELPTSNVSDTTIYLIPSGDEVNLYTEYIYVNGKWEILGSQTVELSNYVTIEMVDDKINSAITSLLINKY